MRRTRALYNLSRLEKNIRDAIFNYIRLDHSRWLVWRDKQPTGLRARRTNFPESTGVPDIMILTDGGTFIAMEIKADERLTLSEAQQVFHRKVLANQGLSFKTCSVEEARRQLKGIR